MKVLLINPPLPERTYPGKAMGIDYLAKVLGDNNHNVDILDLDAPDSRELKVLLEKFKPCIVGLTNLSIQNDLANEIAHKVKTFDRSILVVKGGTHEIFGFPTTLTYNKEYIDYVVVGEGEKSFPALVNAYAFGDLEIRRKSIPGLAYCESGRIRYTGKTTFCSATELNELIPKRLYHSSYYDFDIFNKRKTAQMMTSRGCANSCNFCMESRMGHTERSRSLSSIYSEVYKLRNKGYEAIYFDDSTFTRDKNRVEKICELFREEFPDMIWACNTRIDCLDENLITCMERSGCVYMFTGFESAVPAVLVGLNKTHNPRAYLRNSELIYNKLARSSIQSSVFLIFGAAKRTLAPLHKGKLEKKIYVSIDGEHHSRTFEPECFEDVKTSIDFAVYKLKPQYLSMNVLRLLPGSPFSEDECFSCIRPHGDIVHAGHYDKRWYQEHDKVDIRTRHHIYRAFEGRGSVVPPQMTPDYCYSILEYAVNAVNSNKSVNCRLVVDKAFEDTYMEHRNGKYRLVPFREIAENGSLEVEAVQGAR